MSALATYRSGSPAFTRVPVSTAMRVIGPLTCVIACVVASLSQSTVPVVRTVATHEVRATVASFRCGSCSAGTPKYPAVGSAGVDEEAAWVASRLGGEPHADRHS